MARSGSAFRASGFSSGGNGRYRPSAFAIAAALLVLGVISGVFSVAARTAAPVGAAEAAGVPGPARVAASGGSGCALSAGGTVKCWGDNRYGALGDDTTTNESTPVAVEGVGGIGVLSGVTAITSGVGSHSCALSAVGTVDCWGWDKFGQLGPGATTTICVGNGCSTTPLAVTGLSGVTAVTAGGDFSCALLAVGTVKCWGDNSYGQLGDGITNGASPPAPLGSSNPVQVVVSPGGPPLTGVIAVTAGDYHACALLAAGTVDCWGDNDLGEVGNSPSTGSQTCNQAPHACSLTPVAVEGVGGVGVLSGVTAISAGVNDSCAVLVTGTADCWGRNDEGQLGDGSFTGPQTCYHQSDGTSYACSTTPTVIEGVGGVGVLSGVTSVSIGEYQACALLEVGTAYCWGLDLWGSLGNGTTTGEPACVFDATGGACMSTPVQVHGLNDVGVLTGAISVSAGGLFSCASLAAGTVQCWGYNVEGELGDGATTTRESAPVSVTALSLAPGAVTISGGGNHSCALSAAGSVKCWGLNTDGQLGNNTVVNAKTPVQVHAAGNLGFLGGVAAISAAGSHTCALSAAGLVECWGLNSSGQLGNNTVVNAKTPVLVHGVGNVGFLSTVIAISASGNHTCALLTGGTVDCWGLNSSGQLGNNTVVNAKTPVQVHAVNNLGFLSGVTAISAGGNHTCAALASGLVGCWGLNTSGQLGNNTVVNTKTPVLVHGAGNVGVLGGVKAIDAGGSHSCAMLTGGSVDCWGLNGSGQLGNNTLVSAKTPVAVHGAGNVGFLSGAIAITADGGHSCAVLASGVAACWGLNTSGQLGNNTVVNAETPVLVHGAGNIGLLSGVNAITGGGSHTCALLVAGTVDCWGLNSSGQVGNNTLVNAKTPAKVIGL